MPRKSSVVVRAPSSRVIEVATLPAAFHAAGSAIRVTVIPGRALRVLLSWPHGAAAGRIGRQSAAPRDWCAAARAPDTSQIDRDDSCGEMPACRIWALFQILSPRSRSQPPRRGVSFRVMLLDRLPGDFRGSGAGHPRGRGCAFHASRHAMRQSE